MGLRIAISLFFLSISPFSFAQQDNVYATFLKNSSVAIHKAQKEAVANKKNDVGGLLAKAVILQNYALKLYKSNNSKDVCVSAVARNYAATIIKNLDGKVNVFYLIHDDEKILLDNCADDNELYKESKRAANNPSELDKDYIDSFNNLMIDFN